MALMCDILKILQDVAGDIFWLEAATVGDALESGDVCGRQSNFNGVGSDRL